MIKSLAVAGIIFLIIVLALIGFFNIEGYVDPNSTDNDIINHQYDNSNIIIPRADNNTLDSLIK